MRGSRVVPIADARRIGEKRKCPVVVIWAIEDDTSRFTVTTWGKTKKLCRHAADLGKKLTDAILNSDVQPAASEPLDLPDEPTIWQDEIQP